MTYASVWAQARPLAGRCPSCFTKVQSQLGIVQSYNLVRLSSSPERWIIHRAFFPMPNAALRRLEAHLANGNNFLPFLPFLSILTCFSNGVSSHTLITWRYDCLDAHSSAFPRKALEYSLYFLFPLLLNIPVICCFRKLPTSKASLSTTFKH